MWASPNAVLLSIVALNSNLTLAVDKPPAAVKNGTFLITCPALPVPCTASLFPSSSLDSAGNVTPFADTDTVPVPSDDIVAPPKLIVSPDKNKSANLLVALPKFLVPLPSGIISSATALKSAPLIVTIDEPSLT